VRDTCQEGVSEVRERSKENAAQMHLEGTCLDRQG